LKWRILPLSLPCSSSPNAQDLIDDANIDRIEQIYNEEEDKFFDKKISKTTHFDFEAR